MIESDDEFVPVAPVRVRVVGDQPRDLAGLREWVERRLLTCDVHLYGDATHEPMSVDEHGEAEFHAARGAYIGWAVVRGALADAAEMVDALGDLDAYAARVEATLAGRLRRDDRACHEAQKEAALEARDTVLAAMGPVR